MLQLNVVHLNTRNISNSNSLYIIHDNFKKKRWQDMLNFTTRDRLFGYFHMVRYVILRGSMMFTRL